MTDLVLPLKGEYFDAIKAGEKLEEFRLTTPYWKRRLVGMDGKPKVFARVVLTHGYPGRDEHDKRLVRTWNGWRIRTLTHPHFGADPVEVFAIDVSHPFPLALEAIDLFVSANSTVATIKAPFDMNRREPEIVGEVVSINGLTFKVTGVDSHAIIGPISKGEVIAVGLEDA